MPRLFVVMGVTGEYSDASYWPVQAHMTEAGAMDMIARFDERVREMLAGYRDEDGWFEIPEVVRLQVFNCREGIYTPPKFYIAECELVLS